MAHARDWFGSAAAVHPDASAGASAESAAASGRAGGRRLIVVLDTGVVEGLAPIDEQRLARLRVVREQATDVVLPVAVLAESVFTGNVRHDYHVRRRLAVVSAVEAAVGHAAGALRRAALRGGLDPAPSGGDVIVVAEADTRAALDDVLMVTSDGGDFEVLASLADNAQKLSLVIVEKREDAS